MKTRSLLWNLARFHIELIDSKGQDSFFDYRTLYVKETPELVNDIYEKMLTALHESAGRMDDGAGQCKLLTTGRFAGKNLRQAMESSTRANLEQLVDYMAKNSKFVCR
jgi:hypothetical protein